MLVVQAPKERIVASACSGSGHLRGPHRRWRLSVYPEYEHFASGICSTRLTATALRGVGRRKNRRAWAGLKPGGETASSPQHGGPGNATQAISAPTGTAGRGASKNGRHRPPVGSSSPDQTPESPDPAATRQIPRISDERPVEPRRPDPEHSSPVSLTVSRPLFAEGHDRRH